MKTKAQLGRHVIHLSIVWLFGKVGKLALPDKWKEAKGIVQSHCLCVLVHVTRMTSRAERQWAWQHATTPVSCRSRYVARLQRRNVYRVSPNFPINFLKLVEVHNQNKHMTAIPTDCEEASVSHWRLTVKCKQSKSPLVPSWSRQLASLGIIHSLLITISLRDIVIKAQAYSLVSNIALWRLKTRTH